MLNHIRVAVVEDNDRDLQRLTGFLEQYQTDSNARFDLAVFRDGRQFLQDSSHFDLLLMDIDMPGMTGLQTARIFREHDQKTVLIFITRISQYAISAYDVDALDYIIKPVSGDVIRQKLDKAMRVIDILKSRSGSILLNLGTDSYQRINIEDIYYIVKDRNYLIYSTRNGDYRARGTMKDAEGRFAGSLIVKCASGCMVNLQHIDQKLGNVITVHGTQFTVTRLCRDEFTGRFLQYLREKIV